MNGHVSVPRLCACFALALAAGAAGAQNLPDQQNNQAGSGPPAATGRPLATQLNTYPLPDPVAVEDAVRIGLERNPQAIAGLAGVASARANYRSLAAFPGIQLSASHVEGTSPAPTLNGQNSDTILDVGDVFDTSGQRRYQAAGANAQLGVTRYQFEETRLSLAQQIRDAYWTLASARAQTQIAAEILQDVTHVYTLTQTQETAGAAPHGDVIRSSIDVANARQARLTAEGAERTALAAFNSLLARPPSVPVDLAGNLAETSATPVALPSLPSLETLTQTALVNRPVIKAANEQVRVSDYAVKQARAGRLPDLSVDYERSVQQNSPETVVLAIHLPILDFGSIHYAVKAAQASRSQAEAQKTQAVQQVMQQVAQAYSDYVQAQQQVASYQKEILEPSLTLLNMAQLGYKQGATGILPVIDAENTLRNARTGYITTVLALYKAQDEILAAVGSSTLPATPHT